MENLEDKQIIKKLLRRFNAEALSRFPDKKITVVFKHYRLRVFRNYKLRIFGKTVRVKPNTYVISINQDLEALKLNFKKVKATWFFTFFHEMGHIANGHLDEITQEEQVLFRDMVSEIGMAGMWGMYDTEEERLEIRRVKRKFIRRRKNLPVVQEKEFIADSWAIERLPKHIVRNALGAIQKPSND